MPKTHFVKKARKDNPVAKKGESYYWWKFRYGGKRYSLTPPRPSQLTQSKMSGVYAAQEELEDYIGSASCGGDFDSAKSDLAEALREAAEAVREVGNEYQEGADNQREYFPESEQADESEEKAGELETFADELESAAGDIEGADESETDFDEETLREELIEDLKVGLEGDEKPTAQELEDVEAKIEEEKNEALEALFADELIPKAEDALSSLSL